MINRDLEKQSAQYGSSVISGESPRSYIGVPLIVGNEAKGVISLQYIDRENAFADSDLRLLTTLANSNERALETRVSLMKPSACSTRPNNARRNLPSSIVCKPGWHRNSNSKPSLISLVKRSGKFLMPGYFNFSLQS